ncbi:FitA-like ribbon-helix-helix domain-containing protein [Nocardia sp. NBC_00881]|uniref:FitA-like ribbon-helix-helix domain-containing protein n=1 Tax=Nocardia sp. NBC_00881 TaxID=2975995 RepID=UPI00386CE105
MSQRDPIVVGFWGTSSTERPVRSVLLRFRAPWRSGWGPGDVREALRVRAAQHGRSTEVEVRAILIETVTPAAQVKFGTLLAEIGREVELTCSVAWLGFISWWRGCARGFRGCRCRRTVW